MRADSLILQKHYVLELVSPVNVKICLLNKIIIDLYGTSTGLCKLCIDTLSNCLDCAYVSTTLICTKCKYGYMKTDKSGCVDNCKTGDSHYLSNNGTICIANCYE